MPTKQNYLLSPNTLSNDRLTLNALQDIHDYAPRNLAYQTATLRELEKTLRQAEIETERARLAFDAARAKQMEAGWTFHNAILGAKTEVRAQFGPDSQCLHAIGLKRKSERKRANKRTNSMEAPNT